MKIRREQMDAFSRCQEEAFVDRMVVHLRDDFAKERSAKRIHTSQLPAFVRRGMANAGKHGVIYEQDIKLYLECMVILGPEFDRDEQHRWARDVLRRKDLDGTAKMEQLEQYLVFGLE